MSPTFFEKPQNAKRNFQDIHRKRTKSPKKRGRLFWRPTKNFVLVSIKTLVPRKAPQKTPAVFLAACTHDLTSEVMNPTGPVLPFGAPAPVFYTFAVFVMVERHVAHVLTAPVEQVSRSVPMTATAETLLSFLAMTRPPTRRASAAHDSIGKKNFFCPWKTLFFISAHIFFSGRRELGSQKVDPYTTKKTAQTSKRPPPPCKHGTKGSNAKASNASCAKPCAGCTNGARPVCCAISAQPDFNLPPNSWRKR